MNRTVQSSLPPPELKIPSNLERRFNVNRLMKNGPSGSIYLATDMQASGMAEASTTQVVIKVVRTVDQAESQKIFRELEIHRHLKCKELLKPMLSGLDAEGKVWTVRPYLEGVTLKDKLRQGPLATDEAVWVASNIASALEGLHTSGVLHRDVKPGHVLIASASSAQASSVVLMEAGCPTRIRRTSSHDVVGAPQYLAPEYAMGKPVTARSDLYALGVLFYEMMTGFTPFTGDVDALLHAHQHEFPSPLDEDFPEAVRMLVFSLLSKDVKDRPFSAAYVKKLLLPLVATQSISNQKHVGSETEKKLSESNKVLGLQHVNAALGSMQTQELNSDDMDAMLLAQKANANEQTAEFGTQELDMALLHEAPQKRFSHPSSMAARQTEPLDIDLSGQDDFSAVAGVSKPDRSMLDSSEAKAMGNTLGNALDGAVPETMANTKADFASPSAYNDTPFGRVTLAPAAPVAVWPKVLLFAVLLLLAAVLAFVFLR